MTSGKRVAARKMSAAGVTPTAILIFEHYWDQVAHGATGLIPESTISPCTDVDELSLMSESPKDRDALAATALIKLNGGLGTSMGLRAPKTLLRVTPGATFLDIIVRQVLWARQHYQVRLPLIFLDSFNTRTATMEALEAYPDLSIDGLPLDIMQSEEPKILRSDLMPVTWPADPSLEWCPPGHGDLYPTLLDSGVLDALILMGFKYACVSNSDNLGAAPSATLAGWFERTGAPFAAEVTPRTPMDLKGGHLARRVSDGRLILRESAQTPAEDMVHFTDPGIHPYAHCNTLWFDLRALHTRLHATHGILDLPLIRNEKTVDPTDPTSPEVYQIECAMGAAIQCFEGATAIAVPRSRFIPVKTTNELALLRSDVFTFGEDWVPRTTISPLPVVNLSGLYRTIAEFDRRIPHPLGLSQATELTVTGDWSFGDHVTVEGSVTLGPSGGVIPDGTSLA